MENLILITVGLLLLTTSLSFKEHQQKLSYIIPGGSLRLELPKWRLLAYSTNSISHDPRGRSFDSSDPKSEDRSNNKENKDLDLLDEDKLLKEKVKLKKRLEDLSQKLLSKEQERLNERLKEIDEEMNN